jgi:hypothetical protein
MLGGMPNSVERRSGAGRGVQAMTKKQIAALLRKPADELDGIRDKSKTSNKMVDDLWEKA